MHGWQKTYSYICFFQIFTPHSSRICPSDGPSPISFFILRHGDTFFIAIFIPQIQTHWRPSRRGRSTNFYLTTLSDLGKEVEKKKKDPCVGHVDQNEGILK